MPTRPASPTHPLETALRICGPEGRDMSLVEVVLLACDLSEDGSEVNDIVDGLIRRRAARVLPTDCDPMLRQVEAAA